MKRNIIVPNYKSFRFSPEIVSHAVWLYFRFSLSFRDVEELLAQRGIVVTYAHGAAVVPARLGKRTPMNCGGGGVVVATNGIWTRCFSHINGKRHYLWRAVDQDGNVLDILVQSRRNSQSSETLLRVALRVRLQYVPRVIITDKLKSYSAAKGEILPGVEHRQHSRTEQSSGKLTPTYATA